MRITQNISDPTNSRQFLDYIKSSLPLLERLAEYLNGDISLNEVQNEMKNLKNGKAMYIDDILNEALKAGSDDIKRPIRHLFNIVYKNSVFPDLWCNGIIVPIHKKNDRLDMNNYWGIII